MYPLFANALATLPLDPSPEAPASLDLPLWAIVVVALVIGLLVLTLSYFLLRRYLAKRRTVNTIDQIEKHPATTAASHLSTSTATMDTIDKRATQVYKPAMIDQEKMATLPLPPPSTSLFSDKMELNSEDAMQLFERYMQTERTKGGLSTIDLDIPQQLVNTVQQKMGTIKSTLQQSLRRQKSKSRAAPLNHMFDTPPTVSAHHKSPPCPDAPRKSLSELSRHTSSSTTPSTPTTTLEIATPDVPSPALVKTLTTPPLDREHSPSSTLDHHPTAVPTPNKTASASSPPLPPSQSMKSSASASASTESFTSPAMPCPTFTTNTSRDMDDFYSNTGTISDTSAIHAARRVIRSASRKSKTRSTLINEDAVLKMFNQPPDFSDFDGDAPPQHYRDRRRASTAVSGYTTVSGRSSTTAGAALAGAAGGTSTRYLTNDILVRRASTLGRSYQQSKPSTGRLEGLFDNAPPTPSIKATAAAATVNPANEKVEVTPTFDLTRQQGSMALPIKDDDHEESNKYAVTDDTLLHPNQQPRYLPSTASDKASTPSSSSSISNKKRITTSSNDSSGGKGVMQDRMDNFEGLSAHTDSTGHSRKSSNSVATMVRISQQQHSQTWSGRTQSKRASIPQNHHHQQGPDEPSNAMSPTIAEDDSPSSSPQQPKTFYTMRSTRPKQRTGLPSWYNPEDAQFLPQDKTPAQRERDQYLKTLHGNPPKPS